MVLGATATDAREPTAMSSPHPPLPAEEAAAPPLLAITPAQAARVGRQIWLNESGGSRDGLTAWNDGEDFPSLGIGHFIWFPAGTRPQFEETFPKVIDYMRAQGVPLPAALDRRPVPPPPWRSRQDFLRRFNDPETTALRSFLADTIPVQARFMAERTQQALPKILAATDDKAERAHIARQFARVVGASPDLYPLIDYTNFKGEGTSELETAHDAATGRREGWGLKQVLLAMNGAGEAPSAVLGEFADAARFVLQRRIRNMPASRMWGPGWMNRVDTYRRPLR
jgi:hypothetical protein